MNGKKFAAEAIGTFWLTFGGCGSAVISAGFPHLGIGFLGVAIAFGLTLLTMAYAIGHVSGCHLNPAVTVGLTCGGRFPSNLVLPYVAAQLVGAIAGAAVLYAIANGSPDFSVADGFAANGYAEHSPGKYGLAACLIAEIVLTMMFLFVIMGATHGKAPAGFAPIAIGLALAYSSDQHSCDQYLGESGPQHRPRAFRRRVGAFATLAVLGGTVGWRCGRRLGLSVAQRGAGGRGHGPGVSRPPPKRAKLTLSRLTSRRLNRARHRISVSRSASAVAARSTTSAVCRQGLSIKAFQSRPFNQGLSIKSFQ